MDKNNLKEKTIQEKEINKLDDEELEKVSGGVHYYEDDDHDGYHYEGALDD